MKTFLTFLYLVLSLQCAYSQQKEFSWLIGKWKLKDKNVYESWKIADDGRSLKGISYRVKGVDTVIMERIQFTYDGKFFHYIPDVEGNQDRVDFKIIEHHADGFVAENPQHDFPKIIRYKFIREGDTQRINASIEGNGKVIPYNFERMR